MAAAVFVGRDDDASGQKPAHVTAEDRDKATVSYIVALTWVEDTCRKDGSVKESGHEMVIGSGGALPVDDGVIGRGEFEGTVIRRATTWV